MKAEKGAKVLKTILGFGKVFILNSWRRLVILGHYSLICWQQQKLRRACRRLGTQVLAALEQGDVNPLLAEEVKDTIDIAKGIKGGKDRHYQAISALREKIRTACSPEPPSPPGETGGPGEADRESSN